MLGIAEPMFRFHNFVQTRLAWTTFAGTSNDRLVILKAAINRSPLSLNTLGVVCLPQGAAESSNESRRPPTFILKVLVVGIHGSSSPFQFKHSEATERSGEEIPGKLPRQLGTFRPFALQKSPGVLENHRHRYGTAHIIDSARL